MMKNTTTVSNRLLLLIGSLGPIGHLPASGTLAVIAVGVPMFMWMSTWSGLVYYGFLILFTFASVWLHAVGDRILGEEDSRTLVWDELCGFWLATVLLPFTWSGVVLAVLVERFFDILKIPPANWIERHIPGGWGVVGDDLVAGVYTILTLQLLRLPTSGWLNL